LCDKFIDSFKGLNCNIIESMS